MKEPLSGNSHQDDKLEDALALLAAGVPPDEILSEAGDDAAWLEPLLAAASDVMMTQAQAPLPPPDASLNRMLTYGQSVKMPPAQYAASGGWLATLAQRWRSSWALRLAVGLATVLLIVVLSGGVLLQAAQSSLPGQPLYGLKRAGESIQLNLTQSPQARQALMQSLNQRRRSEIDQLLSQDQRVRVTYSGQVEAVAADTVMLAGLVVQITPNTLINGPLNPGDQVELIAITRPPDSLLALAITLIGPGASGPILAETSTHTPTSISTAGPVSTPTTGGTVGVATQASTAQTAVEPTATAFPATLSPTATPVDPQPDQDTPSPTPARPTSEATVVMPASPTPLPATFTPEPSPAPTELITASPTIAFTATPVPPTPTVTPSPLLTPTPTTTPSPTSTSTATPSPAPTTTASPTAVPPPTATPSDPDSENTPFAAFEITRAEVKLRGGNEDEFEVRGAFVLGSQSDGLALPDETVVITFAGFNQTIPSGSFFRDNDDEGYQFDGGLTRLEIKDNGEFKVEAEELELSGLDYNNPLYFSLQIGNDLGTAEIMVDLDNEE